MSSGADRGGGPARGSLGIALLVGLVVIAPVVGAGIPAGEVESGPVVPDVGVEDHREGDGEAAVDAGLHSDDDGTASGGGSSGDATGSRSLVPPVARLTVDWEGKDSGQEYALLGNDVTLDASASSDPDGTVEFYAFDEDFDGDYEEVESTDPVYTTSYVTEGYQAVRVRVTDDAGETNVTTGQVFVNAPPTARVSYSPSNPQVGESVTFDGGNSSDYEGSITGYEWRIDGDPVASGEQFSREFGSPGEYDVTLVVSDDEDGGPAGETTRTVTVGAANQPPEATFSITPRPAVEGNETTFDASGSTDPDGSIDSYRWDFDGDGTVEENTSDPVTTHVYGDTGFTSVELTVVDDGGETDSAGKDLQVRQPDPIARCTLVPETVAPGETATLDASGSENADSYVFDVDADPGYDTDRYSDPLFDVSFEEAGTYTLGVRAYGPNSDRDDEADCTLEVNRRPTPSLTISPRPVVAGESTTLDASNSTDPDGTIETYQWDFDGDGVVDRNTTDPVTTHRFAYDETGEGYAVVGVTVVDDDGATARTGADVGIRRGGVDARCTVVPGVVEPGETAVIDASNSSNASSYVFDVDGDPAYDTDRYADPRFEFSLPESGEYTVGVRAYGPDGERTDEADCSVVVNAPPEASFTVSPRPAIAGEGTTLDASASTDPDGEVVRYLWDFDGDGSVDQNTPDPVTSFEFPYDATGEGYAVVELTVTDEFDATGNASTDLAIERLDVGGTCTVDPTTVAPGQSVTLSVDPGPAVDSFQYDRDASGGFGAFTESATKTVSYDTTGSYAPRVKVWNDSSERSRVVECDPVTVEEENAPPEATFDATNTVVTGREATFDASASTDPDGQVVQYEWDLDGDGSFDVTKTGSTSVTETVTESGSYVVTLRVTDDDGATDTTERTVEVAAPLQAQCVVSTRELSPGEELTVSVEGSETLDSFQFDGGDGFGDFRETAETTLTYDEPGNYTPRVKAWDDPTERSELAECPTITVRAANAPPVASFDFSPGEPGADSTVTFDASSSSDPDGTIVEYRWDFDGDGTIEATETDPTVTHTYADAGDRTPRLVVVDDRDATAVAENTVPVVDPSGPLLPDWWWMVPLLVGGAGAAGWGIRKFPKHVPGEADDPGRQYATGTFETPGGSETVTVGGVGFEPDVVVLRAANGVQAPPGDRPEDADAAADGGAPSEGQAGNGDHRAETNDGSRSPGSVRSSGLSLGTVIRRGGDLEQTVVSVADDARDVAAAVGATHSGKAIDVLVHGDDHVGSLAGVVREFQKDGFTVEFDASELPAHESGGYVVHYQAFALDDPRSVDVGHFATPSGTGGQTVELGTDADYVSLTACSLSEAVDAAATGEAVTVSHGEAVSVPVEDEGGETLPDRIEQQAVGGGVAAAANAPGVLCGHDDRALHLPFLGDDEVLGRTSARVRELGERLELTYDSVHAPGDETRVVTYLAMGTGEALRPELGHVRVPAPGASRAVDVGFDPGMVALTGVDVERIGVDRSVSGAVPFDWSYGVAMPTTGGEVAEQVLHPSLITDPLPNPPLPGLGAIDPVHAGVTAHPDPTTATAPSAPKATSGTAAVAEGVASTTTGGEAVSEPGRDGGDADGEASANPDPSSHSGPSDLPSGRGAAGVVLTTGDDAGIRGRDEVSVSAFTREGFYLRTYDVHSALDTRPDERRGVLFYAAWPKPTPGPNRQTETEDDEGNGS